MAFELPDLPYANDALEPHIDAETMRIHHDLHHGAYVTNANAALEGTELADASVESVLTNLEALPEDKQTAVRNNAGGHANHSLFWRIMSPDGGGDPEGAFGDLVARHFGSAGAWRDDLKATGMAGRGWAWTAYDWDEGRLFNYVGDAQNTFPIWNATPVVALDVYEHAYFLDYQTDRASYIDAFLTNLDWDVVNGWIDQYGIPT